MASPARKASSCGGRIWLLERVRTSKGRLGRGAINKYVGYKLRKKLETKNDEKETHDWLPFLDEARRFNLRKGDTISAHFVVERSPRIGQINHSLLYCIVCMCLTKIREGAHAKETKQPVSI